MGKRRAEEAGGGICGKSGVRQSRLWAHEGSVGGVGNRGRRADGRAGLLEDGPLDGFLEGVGDALGALLAGRGRGLGGGGGGMEDLGEGRW